MVRMTKNEKRVVKILLENAKTTDSFIAEKLKISSQAVGKIRKKLERNVIESYSAVLDYGVAGINTFAIAFAKFSNGEINSSNSEIEKMLASNPHVIQICRTPGRELSYCILYGFRDINELDDFFNRGKSSANGLVENKEFFTFSSNSMIKNDPYGLFKKIVDDQEVK